MKFLMVFKRNTAYKLRQQGFDIIGTEPNFKEPQLDVYIFDNSPQIRRAFADITGTVATAFTNHLTKGFKKPQETEIKRIFNKRVADDLVDAGFEIYDTFPNGDVPHLNVYHFKRTKAFELYLNDYFTKKGYQKPSER